MTRKNSLQSAAAIVRTLIGGSPLACVGRRRARAQRVVVIVEEEVARRYGHIASSFGSRVVASFICV
jgi:hypothetical protein